MNKLMVFVAGLLGLAMVGYALGPGFFGGFGFVRTAGPAMSVANAKNMTLADKASLLQAIYTDDSSLYSSVLQNYGINRTINQTNFDARSQIANERLQI